MDESTALQATVPSIADNSSPSSLDVSLPLSYPSINMDGSTALPSTTTTIPIGGSGCLLDALPPEVMSMVCKFLPEKSDISSLRLTNTRYGANGTPELCRILHVMFTQKSFQNMLNIANNPAQCKHVKVIDYEALYLSGIEHGEHFITKYFSLSSRQEVRMSYAEFFDSLFHNSNTGAETSHRATVISAWNTYKSLLADQEYIVEFKLDIAIFVQVLPLFTNLQSLNILSDNKYEAAASFQNAYRNTRGLELGLLGSLPLPDGHISDKVSGIRALGSILEAIPPVSRLSRLRVNLIDWSFFCSSSKSMELQLCRVVFSQLQSLTLQFPSFWKGANDTTSEAANTNSNLGLAIRSAPKLEYLDLSMGWNGYGSEEDARSRQLYFPVDVQHVLGEFIWTKLRTLRLRSFTTDDIALSTFLRKHASTLKVLKLKSMWITSTTHGWEPVLELIASEMDVESLELKGHWVVESKSGQSTQHNMEDEAADLCSAILKKETGSIRPCMPAAEICGWHW